VWTPWDHALVGKFGAGQALSDDQFRLVEPFIPAAKPGGWPRRTDMRRVLDALFYVGLAAGVWESVRHHLVVVLREGDGRESSPTAAIVDTQSVKATEKGGQAAGHG
jgi:putative transposase